MPFAKDRLELQRMSLRTLFVARRRLLIGAAALAAVGFSLGALTNQGLGRMLALPADTERFVFTDAAAPPLPGEPGAPPPPMADSELPDEGPASSTPRPARGLTARQYSDVIVRRNIFDSSAVYDPSAGSAGGGDCKSDASVKLLATVVADLPEYSSALMSTGGKDGSATGFVVGDEVSGEGRIVTIEQKKVCTDSGSCFCVGGASSAPGGKAAGDPAASGDGVTRLSDTSFQVDPSVLERALGNVEALAPQMRVVAHKGPDGQIDGYRVSSIRKNSLFEKLGIKNADVVHGVNGQPLTSTEGALATYQALKNERSFSFDITRKNQRMSLQYEVR